MAIALLLSLTAGAFAFDDSAEACILYEPESGTVLYEKNADDRHLIASTTKIMTALVIIENCSLSDVVTIPKECESVIGTSLYLKAGQKFTVLELLYGLLLESANDAAYALAVHCSGSIDGFAKLMNDRAAAIGMKNSHFENPHGLDGVEHYSTARDMALLAAEALKNDTFSLIVSTKTIKVKNGTYTNHNKLLWQVDGLIGVKNGYTKKAGRTLVTACERNGMTLICVTLNDSKDYDDHTALYDEGFKGRKLFRTAAEGEAYASVQVVSGDLSEVGVVPSGYKAFLLKEDDRITEEVYLPKFVYAPVTAGDAAGTIVYKLNGREIYRTELVFASGARALEPKRQGIFDRIFDFFTR